MPDGFGYCTLVFKLNEPAVANYISNSNRDDMIKTLFETAYRLKEGQDSKEFKVENNNYPSKKVLKDALWWVDSGFNSADLDFKF
jgi:hypothetical protein